MGAGNHLHLVQSYYPVCKHLERLIPSRSKCLRIIECHVRMAHVKTSLKFRFSIAS